ncbi:MAG: hypothetical protein KF849_15405 [Rhizobiaceae bacterium]|nr:hypothetical protein [Rhizobiaceae bacterium]
MDLVHTQTTEQVSATSASELIPQSHRRTIFPPRSSAPEIGFNAWREFDDTGWHKLSQPAAARVREAAPDARG